MVKAHYALWARWYMRIDRRIDPMLLISALCFLFGASPAATLGPQSQSAIQSPPGTYRTSWVGNTFGGNGGENGFGYWVQDGADEIEVTPDGTVIAGVAWDEAGRCVGLYKDGQVNRLLLKAEGGDMPDSAWGWGTGNNAIAIRGDIIYVASTGKRLLRFVWKPGDINSARFRDARKMDAEAVGLAARGDTLAVVYPDAVELRSADDLNIIGKFPLSAGRDAAIATDGSLWVLAGNAVRHVSRTGKALGVSVPALERPTALSFDNRGRLLVCENGHRQQVLCFDISSASPRLVSAFGVKGGLRSGVPGLAAPNKLFALCGAGTDAAGNLTVAMSYGNGPNGNLILRSFTPSGKLRWEVMAAAFVDTFGFDPDSDGAVVYSRTAVFDLDLKQTTPGREWRARAFTLDPVGEPQDPRSRYGCSVILRHLQGRRLLYTIGQYAGGYRLYTFDEPRGYLAHEVAQIGESEQWAWDVDQKGGIWHGDAPGKTIRYYAFQGWTSDGKPKYNWQHPQTWPWPEGWDLIRRIKYDAATDTLYLTGYLAGQRVETWGVIGPTARRYDGWLAGKRALRWTNRDLPRDGNSDPKEGPLTPQALDIAGDYLFVGMVKPTQGKQRVHVLRLADGRYVGAFAPGDDVGGMAGWLDMPYALQAIKRRNGEYLILVEEDFRAKNLLYRWRPGS